MPAATFQVCIHGKAPSDTEPFAFACERERAVIVLCDGAGSWGRGVEAADAAAKPMLDSLIRYSGDETAFHHSFDVATACAARFGDFFDATFSAVVAVVTAQAARLAWAGHTGGLLLRSGIVIERARARTLATELARAGTIPWEDIATHRLRHVAMDAVSGDQPPVFDTAMWHVHSGDRLFLGTHLADVVPEMVNDISLVAKHNVLISVDIPGL